MNKSEFIALIRNPELPEARHIPGLKQVLADFPYFTHARVLLAKSLFNGHHYEYEKYLKQTALSVPDREMLYRYIHHQETLETQGTSLVINESQEPETSHLTHAPEEEAVLMHEELLQEALAEEIRDIPMVDSPVQDPVPAALSTEDIKPELMPQPLNIESVPVEQTQIPAADELSPSHDEVQEVVEDESVEQEEAHSFMEWLQLRSRNPEGSHRMDNKAQVTSDENKSNQSVPEKKPVPEAPVAREEEKEETRSEPVVGNEKTPPPLIEVTKADIEEAVAKSNINDFGNILDKFIKENPSISRPKAEFFNPVNMARQSVEEDEDLVTETLANLLYKQGHHRKAIRAYEKLCLLYPSKITYFASLIQKIKTEIKD